MANKKVNGITIAINADTSGVTAGLKDLTSQSVSLSKQLKTVDSLLKLDPKNTELLATKQKLLSESVETSKEKLKALKDAQEDVKKAVASGSIGTEEYIAFQKEIVETENRLKGLENQEDKTTESSHALGNALKDGVAVAAKAAAAALATVTAAAGATVAAVVSVTNATAQQGDEIDKNSQKLGMTAQAYQEWDFIMQHAGSDIDKMGTSVKKLATAVEEPTDKTTAAFQKLGISLEDAKKMSQEDLFAATITALQSMESGTERTAIANDLLGKSAMDLGALLNMSADETAAMRQEVHDLGGVLSDDAVEAAAAYQDSLQNVKTAIGGIKNSVGSQFMPSMIRMMNSVTQIASGNMDAVAGLEIGIDEFVGNIEKMAEDIAAKAEQLLPIIIKVISNNLPKLAQSATKILSTLTSAIMRNLPQLLKAAASIIQELTLGIAEKLPELIPAAVSMLLEIVDGLLDHVDIIIDGAIALVTGLAEGIINSLPILLEKAPEIIEKLVEGIVDAVPKIVDAAIEIVAKIGEFFSEPENLIKILNAGKKIIIELVKGVGKMFKKLFEMGGELISQIWNGLKDSLSKVWNWGKQIVSDLWQGIKDNWNAFINWLKTKGQEIWDAINPFGTVVSSDKFQEVLAKAEENKASHNARGGIFNVPTKAIIGENGAEAVVPLENNTGWIDKLAERINRSGGGAVWPQITVNVYGSDMNNIGGKIAEKIDTALRQYQLQQVRGQGGTAWATQ